MDFDRKNIIAIIRKFMYSSNFAYRLSIPKYHNRNVINILKLIAHHRETFNIPNACTRLRKAHFVRAYLFENAPKILRFRQHRELGINLVRRRFNNSQVLQLRNASKKITPLLEFLTRLKYFFKVAIAPIKYERVALLFIIKHF